VDGDREYTEYVTARLPALRRIALQLTGDVHRGDDLVQQTITRLYLRWRQASQARNLDAYVHRILVHLFLDERRRGWARVLLSAVLPERPAAHEPATAVEDRAILRAALGRLAPRQRAVVVLRYIADRSVDEVAEILGCSKGTVKSQTSDGLARLRQVLDEQSYSISERG
jgi:RNA polymerase sigma-70 factor (sigma-E family)